MNVIQFPRARALQPRASEAMPAGWPDGQVGIELDGLARLIQDRGQTFYVFCTSAPDMGFHVAPPELVVLASVQTGWTHRRFS